MATIKMICGHCKSEDVVKSADTKWCESESTWEIHSLFNNNDFCKTCDGETTIKCKIEGEYYQPKITKGTGMIEGYKQRSCYSFLVWLDKFELIKDHPQCTIITYHDDDIEDPTIVDS